MKNDKYIISTQITKYLIFILITTSIFVSNSNSDTTDQKKDTSYTNSNNTYVTDDYTFFHIEAKYYFIVWVGVVVLYFRNQTVGSPAIVFLRHFNIKWVDKPIAIFFDFIFYSIFGAFIATIFTNPINPQQAITAGLGLSGILNSVIRN